MRAVTKIQSYIPGLKGEKNNSDNTDEYPARIKAFIRDLDGRKSEALNGDGDTLEKLFRLVRSLHGGHAILEKYYFAEEAARKEVEKQRDALRISVDDRRREISGLQARIEELGIKHSAELNDRQIEHQRVVESLTQNYDATVTSLTQNYDATVTSMNQEYKSTVTSMSHEYKSETDRLKGQLLVNQDDSKPWPDDKLKIKFNELRLKVDNIAAPARIRVNVPRGHQLPLDVDPTGFLRRVDSAKAHVLIKSRIWSVLYDHFFSLPFGFGVLGPAGEQNTLLMAYTSWYAVVEGRNTPSESTAFGSCVTENNMLIIPVPSTAEDLKIFRTSEAGNKWRSATFQSAFSTIVAATPSNHSTAGVSYKNLESAIQRMSRVFSAILQFSSLPCPTSESEIREIATLAREVALQFGVHPAYLKVVMPQHGQRVEIGEEYHDCYDGAENRGEMYTVDLVKSAGLQKVGNGRGESRAVRTIVPCEIFAEAGTAG
jgi:hypothetical protein